MGKLYVPVISATYKGELIPTQFKYGEWIKILKVTDSRRRASLVAGAVGVRHTCIIRYNDAKRKINLFKENNNKWFIETYEKQNKKANKIFKDCPFCMQEILRKPLLDKHQGRYSILCPYCRFHRSEWVNTIDEAIRSWNKYMRDGN